jgi:hypothetical protein
MLREMAADERPREKLKLRGSAALSDGDLLAIILNTGLPGETVTVVSQRLLADHGGLRGIFRLDVAELARIRGLGDAKAVRVNAALELGRRLAAVTRPVRSVPSRMSRKMPSLSGCGGLHDHRLPVTSGGGCQLRAAWSSARSIAGNNNSAGSANSG